MRMRRSGGVLGTSVRASAARDLSATLWTNSSKAFSYSSVCHCAVSLLVSRKAARSTIKGSKCRPCNMVSMWRGGGGVRWVAYSDAGPGFGGLREGDTCFLRAGEDGRCPCVSADCEAGGGIAASLATCESAMSERLPDAYSARLGRRTPRPEKPPEIGGASVVGRKTELSPKARRSCS
jgi:hypothetical protein